MLNGWWLLPNGFAIPVAESPISRRAVHLAWKDNRAVTPWAWRQHENGNVEIADVVFPDGAMPSFGCSCHVTASSQDPAKRIAELEAELKRLKDGG